MSQTTIYKLWPNDRYEELEGLQNSHGSATVVWGEIFNKFIGVDRKYPNSGYMFRIGELWPLYKRMDIPEALRAVLAITYDNAYISRDNYARAAADIRMFLATFDFDPRNVNHWPRIAEVLESNPDCPAIGFNWTSVCGNPFAGDWNEETEDYDQPDWGKYWEVYGLIDSLKGDQE